MEEATGCAAGMQDDGDSYEVEMPHIGLWRPFQYDEYSDDGGFAVVYMSLKRLI